MLSFHWSRVGSTITNNMVGMFWSVSHTAMPYRAIQVVLKAADVLLTQFTPHHNELRSGYCYVGQLAEQCTRRDIVQLNLSNPDTLGTEESVLISEVS